jgi:hypothetical protein
MDKDSHSSARSGEMCSGKDADNVTIIVDNARTSLLAAIILGWTLEDAFTDDDFGVTLVQLRASFGFTVVLCSIVKGGTHGNCNTVDKALDGTNKLKTGSIGGDDNDDSWVTPLLVRWRARGVDSKSVLSLQYASHMVSDIQKAQRRLSSDDWETPDVVHNTTFVNTDAVIPNGLQSSQPIGGLGLGVASTLGAAAVVPAVATTMPLARAPGISLAEAAVPLVAAPKSMPANLRTWDPLDCNLDDFQNFPLPAFYAKLRMGNTYVPLPPNSRFPVKFTNEYFDGVALLLCRTDDPAANPYRERFEGERAKKYQFEVQVQGRFTKKIDSSDGLLYMGGEISKKMSLGMLTKGMCSTILKIGRTISGPGLHNSYGDKDGAELPHVGIPMWSGLDNVIITRPATKPGMPRVESTDQIFYVDYLPKLGCVLQEDPGSKKRRFSSHSAADVNVDATYTMSFKTSNIDIRRWTLSNIPLLSGTDLHSFWGDASLRTGCWLVPTPEVPGPNVGAVLQTSTCRVQLPKYHYQREIKYIFSIDIQHISNIDLDNEPDSVRMLRYMLNDGFGRAPSLTLIRAPSLHGSSDLFDLQAASDTPYALSSNTNIRRRRCSGMATNMVSYTSVIDKSKTDIITASQHNIDSIPDSPNERGLSQGGDDEFMECSPAKTPCGSDSVGLVVKQSPNINTTRKVSRSGSIGSEDSHLGEMHLTSDEDEGAAADEPEVFFFDEYASHDDGGRDTKDSECSSDEAEQQAPVSHVERLGFGDEFDRDFEGFIDDFEPESGSGDRRIPLGTSDERSIRRAPSSGSGSGSGSGSVVRLDQMTMLNGSVSAIPQPMRLSQTELRALQQQQLSQYFFHNSQVVAIIEVDDPRFMHTQRLSMGQKGRRTMYAFAVHDINAQGLVHTSYVLRTYQEWKSELPVFQGYEAGSANSFSDKSNAYATKWLHEERSRVQGSDDPIARTTALTMHCRNINYARVSDIERRRQDLDNSYRTLLLRRHKELHGQQDVYQQEQDAIATGEILREQKPKRKQNFIKSLFGRSEDDDRRETVGDVDALYASQVSVDKVNAFLRSTPHHMRTFLNKPVYGGGVGSKKLRAGILPFILESYCCVQIGNFFWSQEYIGLTTDELVFIKPASRLGVSKRITLPLLALNSVRVVTNTELPFTLGGTGAFSVSTFSRVFLLFVKEDLRDLWIRMLGDKITEKRQLSIASGDDSNQGSVRHLELHVKPKGYELDSDQYVLNARSFTSGSACAYRNDQPDAAWPLQNLPYYLTHPHIVVEKLLKMVLRLVVAASEDTEEMRDAVEKLWIDFLDGAALLQRADLSVYSNSCEDPRAEKPLGNHSQDRTDDNAQLSMFLNLYHVMILHSFLVQGLPDTAHKHSDICANSCYEAFGDCFSICDLQNNIIQKGLLNHATNMPYTMQNYLAFAYESKPHPDGIVLEFCRDSSITATFSRVPSKLSRGLGFGSQSAVGEYSYGGTISITDKEAFAFSLYQVKDMRLMFALNSGFSTLSPGVMIFTPRDLHAQLDSSALSCIRRCVKVGVAGKAGIGAAPDVGSSEDTVYVLSIPGLEAFLRIVSKMKSISGPDSDFNEMNDSSPLRVGQRKAFTLPSGEASIVSSHALELLSKGSAFSGDRNFLAFILHHVKDESGDLQIALASAIISRNPKTPLIKTRKMPASFHYLEEKYL